MKIISLLVEQERYENLTELLDLFETLKDVKSGKKDINIEAEKFGEHNRSKYVYPKFGGKEKFLEEMNNPKNQSVSSNMKSASTNSASTNSASTNSTNKKKKIFKK